MAETPTPTPRHGGLLAVSAVFVLGTICGAAAFFAGSRLLPRPLPLPVPFAREGRAPVVRMARELELDERQTREIRAVLDRARGKIDVVLEGSRAEIRELLRPDQRERFDRMRPPRGSPGRPGLRGLPRRRGNGPP
jgi:hypothetical protein